MEGINYFADTMPFPGTILALASATPKCDWKIGAPTLSAAAAQFDRGHVFRDALKPSSLSS